MHIRRVLHAIVCVALSLAASLSSSAQLTRQTSVATRAGTGTGGYTAAEDGAAASAAKLNAPQGVVADVLGNLYIADTANNRVRKVDFRTGVITTIAGSGVAGYRVADENVVATFGQLNAPQDVALDGLGNLYIADTGNHRVRKVVLSTNIMTTFAGSGGTAYNQQELGQPTAMAISQPVAVAVDPYNNLYIADAALNRVFFVAISNAFYGARQGQIETLAGTTSGPYTTAANEEGVYPSTAHINAPRGVAIDRYGAIYIADTGNKRIRKMVPNNNLINAINTIAGNGNDYSAASEGGLATATGIGAVTSVRTDIVRNIFFSVAANNRILKISVVSGNVATYAGTGAAAFADGVITAATLSSPTGITLDANGTVYVADTGNNRLRAIPVATGNLIVPTTPVLSSNTSQVFSFTSATATTLTSLTVIGAPNAISEFTLGQPTGCSPGGALAAGAVCSVPVTFTPAKPGHRMAPFEIVTAAGTQRFGLSGVGAGPLVIYSPQNAVAFAGSTTGTFVPAEDNGPATAAHFQTLANLTIDGADNVVIGDERSNRVRRITPGGTVTTVAGNSLQGYKASDEGALATAVSVDAPRGVATDAAGNIYISTLIDGDSRIRKVDAVTGKITSIAGNGNVGVAAEGIPAISAVITSFTTLLVDPQGNLYFVDTVNYVHRIDAGTGLVTSLVAGFANVPSSALNCTAKGAQIVDDNGILYVSGQNNLFRINPMTGSFSIVGTTTPPNPLPSGAYGAFLGLNNDILFYGGNPAALIEYNPLTDTYSTAASFNTGPSTGFAIDSIGNAVYQTVAGYQLVKSSSQSATLAFTGTTVVGQTSVDSPRTLSLFNLGMTPFTLATPATGGNPLITSDFQASASSTCPLLTSSSSATSLAPGQGCQYTFKYIPVAPGTVQGTAVFTDNQFGSTVPVTQTSFLTGTASGTAVTTSLGLTGLANAIAGTAQTITVSAYSGPDQTRSAPGYTGTVHFASNDPNTGVLPADYTFTAADAGVHTFTVTLKLAGSVSVGVNDKANTSLAAGKTVTITPAAPINFTVKSGSNQTVDTNAQFPLGLVASVKDTYGNGVPGVAVNFTFPTTGASASASGSATQTDSFGETNVRATANGIVGSYNITATAPALGFPVYFQATNQAAVFGFAVAGSATAFTYGPDIRLTATLTPATYNGKTPTGLVSFFEGATLLGTSSVAGQTPSILVPAPSIGTHTYTASYPGDGTYPAATAGTSTATLVVTKGGSLISVPFTTTILRPGSFAINIGNDHGQDSSTKAYLLPTGNVTYTISARCGTGTNLTGSLPLVNGVATFNVPADCPAGGYNLTFAYAGDSNYNALSNQQSTALTVTAPVATVGITNIDQLYDGTPKSVTVTTTPAGLAYSVAYGGSNSGAPTFAGTYPILVTITDPNYSGSATSTLIVRKGPAQIVWPLIAPITYGTPLSTVQLNASTTVLGTFAFTPAAGTILTPGVRTLSVTFTPTDSPSTPTTATQTIMVTTVPLTITAANAGRAYGTANPTFTATVTGAVNGDTFTTSSSSIATTASPLGTYPIVPIATGTNLAFYTPTYVNGTLTVTGAPATITVSNLNQTVDGSPKPVTFTTVPAGLAASVTYSGSATVPTTAGTYAVVATITDPNYTGTANGVLTLVNGAAVVTWANPAAIAYGTPLSATQLSATASTAGTYTYTPSAGTVLLPGTQTLSLLFTPTNGAPVTNSTVTLVVNKGALTVTAANAARVFGIANPALTATVAGAVNGDTFVPTATTAATPASAVGTYPIIAAVSGANAGAYNITYVNATLTITTAPPTVTLTLLKPSTYVGDTATFTAFVSGALGTPTGTVEFFNGTTSLGVKPLAAGVASTTISTLAAGTYSITAAYSGDASFSPATSAVAVQTIFTSDYTIAVSPPSLTIRRGNTGTAVFTVTPTGNFTGTINFACNSLPAHTKCTFAPATLAINGVAGTTTLTIDTGVVTASNERMSPLLQTTGSGIALAGMLCLFLARRRSSLLPRLLLVLLFSAMALAGISGCGASTSNLAPTGTFPLAISAGVSTGGSAHSVNLTVNIIE